MNPVSRFASVVSLVSVFSVGTVLLPSAARAQDTYWGVAAELSPQWKSLKQIDVVFDADALDISGTTFRIGFVRGQTLGAEWGVSFVRKGVKEGGVINRGRNSFHFGDDVAMVGVEINKFAVFTTIRDRAQIGLIVGGGVARVDGTAIASTGEVIEAKRALAILGSDVTVQPQFRLELAGAAIVMAGFKIRISGGFDWPGTTRFTIGGVYFIGER